MNSACLSDDQLLALATGEAASDDLLEHVDHCAQCQGRVSDLRGEIADLRSVSGGSFNPLANTLIGDIAGTSLPTGTVIGRYVVISDLSGGRAGVYRV